MVLFKLVETKYIKLMALRDMSLSSVSFHYAIHTFFIYFLTSSNEDVIGDLDARQENKL